MFDNVLTALKTKFLQIQSEKKKPQRNVEGLNVKFKKGKKHEGKGNQNTPKAIEFAKRRKCFSLS